MCSSDLSPCNVVRFHVRPRCEPGLQLLDSVRDYPHSLSLSRYWETLDPCLKLLIAEVWSYLSITVRLSNGPREDPRRRGVSGGLSIRSGRFAQGAINMSSIICCCSGFSCCSSLFKKNLALAAYRFSISRLFLTAKAHGHWNDILTDSHAEEICRTGARPWNREPLSAGRCP